MPKATLVTAARVRQFHAEGKKVLTWTVNQTSAMRRLGEAGVDGMIGDDPMTLAEGFKVSEFQGFARHLKN
jgi:glycerophosphoryl diester phosphodiesterase